MKIIKTSSDNWKDLKKVRIQSLRESPESFGASLSNTLGLEEQDWRKASSSNEGLVFFLAYINQEPVGMIGLARKEELISMWVSPDFRNKSIGSALVNAVKEHSCKNSYARVILKVEPTNLEIKNYYRRHGFIEIEGTKNAMFWQS